MNKKKKNIIIFSTVGVLIIVGLFLFLGNEPKEIIAKNEYRVAYFGASVVTPYWIELNNAFSEVASKKKIILEDFSSELDSAEDNFQFIDDFPKEEYDAIVWGTGGTSNLSQHAVKTFGEEGIPFFTFDQDVKSEFRNGFVTVSNYESSRLIGQYIYDETSGVGNVLVIVPNSEHDVAVERKKGVVDILSGRDMNIKIIDENDTLWTTQRVYDSVVEEFNKDIEYSAIYTAWDEATLVARNYAERVNKNTDAIYTGFDGLDKMLEAIDEEYVHATVIQPTGEIAKESIEMVIKHLEDIEYEKEIFVPGIVVTKENVQEYL